MRNYECKLYDECLTTHAIQDTPFDCSDLEKCLLLDDDKLKIIENETVIVKEKLKAQEAKKRELRKRVVKREISKIKETLLSAATASDQQPAGGKSESPSTSPDIPPSDPQ